MVECTMFRQPSRLRKFFCKHNYEEGIAFSLSGSFKLVTRCTKCHHLQTAKIVDEIRPIALAAKIEQLNCDGECTGNQKECADCVLFKRDEEELQKLLRIQALQVAIMGGPNG